MFARRVLHANELEPTLESFGAVRLNSQSDWLSLDRSCRLHLVDKRFLDHFFSTENSENATSDKFKLTRTFPRPQNTPLEMASLF